MDGEHAAQEKKGGRNSRRSARACQEHALCEQLANDARRGGSECSAHCHFTLTSSSTGKQQICNIGARDQKHKTDAAHKHKQRRPDTACEGIIKSLQEDAKTNIIAWVFAVQTSRRGIELTTRLLQAYPIRQANKAAQPVEIRGRTSSTVAPQLQQCPQQLLAIHAIEPRRHYTDYGIWHSIHLKGFPDDVRIGANTVSPERVAQHDELTSPRLVLLWSKEPAQLRMRAQNGKEVIGNHPSGNALRRLPRAADVELP